MNELLEFFSDFNAGDFDWLAASLRGAFVYLFVIWAALVVWVARDVVGRTKTILLQTGAIVLVILLNIFGLLIYLILRPQKTLVEKYYEDLERKALTESEEVCLECNHALPFVFHFCPECGHEARVPCGKCKKLNSKHWKNCAFCGEARSESKKSKPAKKA